MRPSLARYSAPVSFVHAPSLADFITTIAGFKVFGTHNGLKHDAEREARDYVANGMLIAAALALGFSAERTHAGSPNAYFNISSRQAA